MPSSVEYFIYLERLYRVIYSAGLTEGLTAFTLWLFVMRVVNFRGLDFAENIVFPKLLVNPVINHVISIRNDVILSVNKHLDNNIVEEHFVISTFVRNNGHICNDLAIHSHLLYVMYEDQRQYRAWHVCYKNSLFINGLSPPYDFCS